MTSSREIDSMHWSVCQAVAILNSLPDADAQRANTFLRQALADYAPPMTAREIEASRDGGASPELPEPVCHIGPDMFGAWPNEELAVYTGDQMRAYGEACRRMGKGDE